MGRCATCGNEYDKTFDVMMQGKTHTFDSFECAISALAPRCSLCDVRIVGHGVEEGGRIYCCVHCAGRSGGTELKDRD